MTLSIIAFRNWAAWLAASWLLVGTAAAYDFAGGTGTPDDPYQIATVEQLVSIGADPNLLDKHYLLLNDLDLDPNLPGGQVFDRAVIAPSEAYLHVRPPCVPFTGTFDGRGHSIRNLSIGGTITNHLGLFGVIGEHGEVRNLGVEEVRISVMYSEHVGALAGTSEGTVRRCHATGRIAGYGPIGGLIGSADGRVVDSHASVRVSGSTRSHGLGGLVGANSGTIARCHATGAVFGGVRSMGLGGLTGSSFGDIINCYAGGSITGGTDNWGLGGLTSYNGLGSIVDSYTDTRISAGARSKEIGGLAGTNAGIILHCYAAGAIQTDGTCTIIGGLVAEAERGRVDGCFWDVEATEQSESAGGTGLPTATLWDVETFLAAGWDFAGESGNGPLDVWLMPEAGGYPTLASLSDAYVPPTLDGRGTPDDPFRIVSARDFSLVRYHDPCACYELMNDVDLTGITWPYAPIPSFDGTFNGAGFTISHLTIDGLFELALFGKLGPHAVVLALKLKDADITGAQEKAYYTGMLAGRNRGRIVDCSVNGNIIVGDDSEYIGGLVGLSNGQVHDCHAAGEVRVGADSYCSGGLTGTNSGTITNSGTAIDILAAEGARYSGCLAGSSSGLVVNCHAAGRMSCGPRAWRIGGLIGENSMNGVVLGSHVTACIFAGSSSRDIGGLIGSNRGVIDNSCVLGPVSAGDDSGGIGGLVGASDGVTTDSYATGLVSSGARGTHMGGFIGGHYGSIADCWASSTVSGGVDSNAVGGFVGGNHRGAITNCYTTGHVTAGEGTAHLGGFAGFSNVGIQGCFWDIETSGLLESAAGNGLTTIEMQKAATFQSAGWDIVGEHANGTGDPWLVPESGGYPMLTAPPGVDQPHFLEGAGTPDEPYRIADAEDLGAMRHHDPSAHYQLTADIDLSAITWASAPIPYFNGTLKGSGFTLSRLTIRGTGSLALFARLTERATVADLRVEDASIIGADEMPNLAVLAVINSGALVHCHTEGSVNGGHGCSQLGGLVAYNHGEITGCSSLAPVSAGDNSRHIGGLVGCNQGEIVDCSAAGAVSGGNQNRMLGGLAGQSTTGISGSRASGAVTAGHGSLGLGGLVGTHARHISDCHASGAVTGGDGCEALGGLVGSVGWRTYYVISGEISDCSAAGNLSAGNNCSGLGGLVGRNHIWAIVRSCATGDISVAADVNDLGGLIGSHRGIRVRDCYATGNIWGGSRAANSGGLIGRIENPASHIEWCYAAGELSAGAEAVRTGGLAGVGIGEVSNSYFLAPADGGGQDTGFGIPLTDAQMKQQASFAGWDFENIWMICEGKDYPRLRWEGVGCGE